MNNEEKILELFEQNNKILDELHEHTKKLSEHDNMFEKINKTLEDMHRSIILIEDDVHNKIPAFEDMHRSIILIEDDVHNKIPALMDAHGFHQDHLERHDKEIEDLQKLTENHSIRIISLEDDIKEHTKQLEHISSTN